MVYLKDVVSLKLSSEKCTGCGRCVEVCPRGVFAIENKKALLHNRDYCIECGACQSNCAFDALSVTAGVGCAAAMFNGLLRYGDMEKGSCGCGDSKSSKGGCC